MVLDSSSHNWCNLQCAPKRWIKPQEPLFDNWLLKSCIFIHCKLWLRSTITLIRVASHVYGGVLVKCYALPKKGAIFSGALNQWHQGQVDCLADRTAYSYAALFVCTTFECTTIHCTLCLYTSASCMHAYTTYTYTSPTPWTVHV